MPSGQQARLLLWRSKVDSSLGESTFFSVKMLFEKEQKEAGFGPFFKPTTWASNVDVSPKYSFSKLAPLKEMREKARGWIFVIRCLGASVCLSLASLFPTHPLGSLRYGFDAAQNGSTTPSQRSLIITFLASERRKRKILLLKMFFVFINWYSNRKYAFRPNNFILSHLGPILSRILA